MYEWTSQLSFSFHRLLKQRVSGIGVLLGITILPLLLILANRMDHFIENWLALIHLQMILSALLTPILVNSIWSGRLHDFEKKTLLYYLRYPALYFLSEILVVWLVLAGSLIGFDSLFWLIRSNGADAVIWAGAILQIILTTGLLVSLTGFLSLLLRRTIYSLLPILMYLLVSLSVVRRPMFALWFSPNVTEQIITESSLILERGWLLVWIGLFLAVGTLWFGQKVARR